VAPASLFEAIAPLLGLQAKKLGIRVHTDLAADLPAVLCDRTMVEQVLLNLARNGMQAMGETPVQARHLQFRVRRAAANAQQAWLEFAVIDSGSGIAPEVAEQLFTPFFTTKREGMGLGLSLCRTVIEQHGGHLGYSPRAGGGTEFVFTLPVVLAEATALQ
jgi:two-component system sensor histidine kinase DctS